MHRMNTTSRLPVTKNEQGAALMQVVFIGALLAVMAYMAAQMMTHSDKANMQAIRRNENLTYSALIADQIADRTYIKKLSTTVNQVGGGAEKQYQ